MASQQVCIDPRVKEAAERVLRNIINGAHGPWYMPEIAREAQCSLQGQDVTAHPSGATGFGLPEGHGIVWMTSSHGRVFLFVPDFQDGEGLGWLDKPVVVLVNDATVDQALRVVDALANELVTCRHV